MKLLRDPLFHFLVLGALLFVGYQWLNRGEPGDDPGAIVVSAGQIEHMASTFARTWQRPPSPDELKGLVDAYVEEEVMSREAVRLGLDRDDTVIRRRLHQKMEFIAEDLASQEPGEGDLQAYFAAHPDAFRQDQRFTFRQVFLSPERRGERLEADAAEVLVQLAASGAAADVTAFGDPTLLPSAIEDEPQPRVESQFGREFAAALGEVPLREWTGPLGSAFGQHLVWIDERVEGRVPALDEVRDLVLREWDNARRTKAKRAFLAGLLEGYEVRVEWPEEGGGGAE